MAPQAPKPGAVLTMVGVIFLIGFVLTGFAAGRISEETFHLGWAWTGGVAAVVLGYLSGRAIMRAASEPESRAGGPKTDAEQAGTEGEANAWQGLERDLHELETGALLCVTAFFRKRLDLGSADAYLHALRVLFVGKHGDLERRTSANDVLEAAMHWSSTQGKEMVQEGIACRSAAEGLDRGPVPAEVPAEVAKALDRAKA